MSLSFLFCKPWHPATTWNQKKIWEAEQKDAKDKKDEAAANKELKRDSDRRFYEHLAGGKEQDPSSTALNFMYAPPPGFQQPQEEELNDDDESVKKFKALAKMKSDPNFSAATSCSELEKLVGRRKNPGVSLAEQQERFPFLKDAPVEHAYAAGVKVNFKPFNNVVRHVRCMRCEEWGHRSGDRECKRINDNPNDYERRLREDPMSHLVTASAGEPGGGEALGGSAVDGNPNEDADSAFVNSLSSKKKRRLLKMLQKMEAGEGEGAGEEEEEEKGKRKKKGRNKSRKKKSSKGEGSGRIKGGDGIGDGRKRDQERGGKDEEAPSRSSGKARKRKRQDPPHLSKVVSETVAKPSPPEEDGADDEVRERQPEKKKKTRRGDDLRSSRRRGSSHRLEKDKKKSNRKETGRADGKKRGEERGAEEVERKKEEA